MIKNIIVKAKNSIKDFLYEEEGNITRNKVLTVGGMMIIMGMVLAENVLAAHRSHSSHSSHRSHSSGSSNHSSHVSHSSHSSYYGGNNIVAETTTVPRTYVNPYSYSIPKNNNIVSSEITTPNITSNSSNLDPDFISNSVFPSQFQSGFQLPNVPKVVIGDH